MILKNYWALSEGLAKATGSYTDTQTFPTKPVDTSGNEVITFGFSLNAADPMAQVSAKAGLSVLVGSGDDTPAADDYALETDITSSISSFSVVKTYTIAESGNGYDIAFLVSGTNGTGATITISEVGLMKTISSTWNSADDTDLLLARFLLTDPIVVADGAGFSFAFKWAEA